jgi:aminoglycoside phosphotransferase (APT) family kinase protein
LIAKAFPNAAALQDPERMADLFRTHLPTATDTLLVIDSCTVDYIRPSNTRISLQYTLRGTTASGEPFAQIVTGLTYDTDRARPLAQRLVRQDPAASAPLGPLALAPVSYSPELDLLIQVFPYDYRLPGLLRLFQGAPEMVEPIVNELGDGPWTVEQATATTARYRPDMRGMVRLDVAVRGSGGELATRRAYAKVYREGEEARRAHHVLRVLAEGTAREDHGFAVARPIAYVEEWQTLLLGEVPGTRLLQIVRRRDDAGEAAVAVRQAARAVAGFHQFPFPEGLLPVAAQDQEERLATVAETLRANNPGVASDVDRLVEEIGGALDGSPLMPTHFDLKQGHMLVDEERVGLLDFDKLALGDPLIDVANLVATLGAEREGSERRGERRLALVDAFTEEYFAHVPAGWRDRFPARLALAALAEAATTGRGQRGRGGRADVAARAASAVEQAQRALAGD